MRLGSSSDESDEEPNQNRSKSNQRSLQQSFSASRSNPKYKSQSQSSSPPPDPQISTFLANQRLNNSSETEAEKAARLARFSGSAAPKSRYQREKEEAERKKREEEKEAANAYTAFLQDMERPREDGRGTGSKKSGYQDKGKGRAMGFVSAGGEKAYEPSRPPPISSSRAAAPTNVSSAFGQDEDEDEAESSKPAPRKEPPGKRKRAMDDFLGQIQRDQAEREERLKTKIGDGVSVSSLLAFSGQKSGSRDFGDPLTSNLSVINLPGDISEQALGTFFSQWGDIATVKIMWPRDDSNAMTGGAGAGMTQFRLTRSAGLMGFVSYMNREDAEYAFKETDGVVWGGSPLKIGWGKAMPKPSRPLFYKPKATAAPVTQSRPRRSQSPTRNARRQRQAAFHVPPRERLFALVESRSKEDEAFASEEKLIRTVAEKVRQHGQRFEDLIRQKEKDNEKFKFLQEEDSLMSQFFLCLSNESFIPEVPPTDFVDEGYASVYSTDDSEVEEIETLRKTRKADSIGPVARRRIEAMLKSITPRRERIAKCMAFCLEHASAADAISELLCQSVLLPSTPIPRKLARLHVISDVLHNSASPVPNAWKYRSCFENRLISVFSHLGDVARSFPGRMKSEAFRLQIVGLLDVWESWMVFPGGTLEECKKAFEKGRKWNGGVEVEGSENQERERGDLDVEGLDGEDLDGENLDGDDLDGEAMDMS